MVYDITCFQCDSNGNCNNRQPCDGRMQYWPKKENNKLTHVTLTGLQPNTSYVLRVAAENGVSYLYGPNSNRIVEIQFGTKISGKDRKVCLFFVFFIFLFIHFWLGGGGVGAKRDVCSFIYTHISSLALYFELFNGGKKKKNKNKNSNPPVPGRPFTRKLYHPCSCVILLVQILRNANTFLFARFNHQKW